MTFIQQIKQVFHGKKSRKNIEALGLGIRLYGRNIHSYVARRSFMDHQNNLTDSEVLEFLRQMEVALYTHIWVPDYFLKEERKSDTEMIKAVLSSFNRFFAQDPESELRNLFKVQERRYYCYLRLCARQGIEVPYIRIIIWTFFVTYEARLALTPNN